MPYVNDAFTRPETSLATCINVTTTPPTVVFETMWNRKVTSATQYGWRSFGEHERARESLMDIQDHSKWADTARIILAMERVERSLTNPLIRSQGGWDVHERTYSVSEKTDMVAPLQGLYGAGGVPSRHFTPSFELGFSPATAVRSDSFLRTEGGKLLRNSRPTLPHASLGQWIGELRSLNGLVSKPNLRGSDKELGKTVGGSYLAWQFGFAPFIGDILKAAEAVLAAGPVIQKFLLDSNKLQKRRRELLLTQDAISITGINSGSVVNNGQQVNTSHHVTSYGTVSVGFKKAVGFDSVRSNFKISLNVNERVRSFATYEYFAYDPDGFLEKLASYEQRARHLLGVSLTPDLLWELTPWTWLSDWFFDIGGFLSYQVSVESDSLVCRQSGTVYERDYELLMIPNVYSTSGSSYIQAVNSADAAWNPGLSMRYQRRLAGTPYDMGVDWSGFSTKRWFILGSLGLTKGPGIKWH